MFVGRLPREVTQNQLQECFEEFGEVLEVFVIASQAASGVGCAFVRMEALEAAEQAIADLHEQRILIPEMAELGPMQVAFAKGEAMRLGIDEKEEILPSYREARMKVEEHKEKKVFFEAMTKQQEIQELAVQYQQAVMQQQQQMMQQLASFSKDQLVALIKDGQRSGGQPFKQKWWSFCDQGWSGRRDYDPTHHPPEILVQFAQPMVFEYGIETWVRKHFPDMPDLPPPPPMMPGMPPPGMQGGPGMMPPGMMGPPMGGGKGGPPMMPPGFPPFGGMPGGGPPGMMRHGGGGFPPGGGRGGRGGGCGPSPSRPRDNAKPEPSDGSDSESGDIQDINADDI